MDDLARPDPRLDGRAWTYAWIIQAIGIALHFGSSCRPLDGFNSAGRAETLHCLISYVDTRKITHFFSAQRDSSR